MLVSRFEDSLARLGLAPRSRLLIAVSGGPDSVALLDLLATSGGHTHPLTVAHVDHGIHRASGAVAQRVEALASSYRLAYDTVRLELGPDASETVARDARYSSLEAMREAAGAEYIVTGHHADDQAETVLLRVLSGTGPAGLAAMAAVRGVIVRPLLPFRREELARYVLDRNLPVWEDPANQDPKHLRSWLRHSVLPQMRGRLPAVDTDLVRVATQGSIERMAWDRVLDALPGLEWTAEPGGGSVAAAPLAGYDSILGSAVLRALARRVGLTLGADRATRALEFLSHGQSGRRMELGDGWILALEFGRARLIGPGAMPAEIVPEVRSLALDRESGAAEFGRWALRWRVEPAPEAQPRDGLVAWFIPGSLQVRLWQAGDCIRPLKGRGSRLVVKCFQEAKVARENRSTWPMLLDQSGQVIWVPGVCRSEVLVPEPGAEAVRVDAHIT